MRCASFRPAAFALAVLAGLSLTASPVLAQTRPPKPPDPSHWGVNFSFTPSWQIAPFIKKIFNDDSGGGTSEVNVKGKELTIGFVRGSRRGGDWGVAYVRKPLKDGLALSKTSVDCFSSGPNNNQQTCLHKSEQHYLDHVVMNGLEVHWFIAVARIKDRVQIGVNIAGGFAKLSGNIRNVEDRENSNFVPTPGGGGTQVITNEHTDETQTAKEAFELPVIPLMKFEVGADVIVTPALKVKGVWGLNIPSKSARLIIVYLFGAK